MSRKDAKHLTDAEKLERRVRKRVQAQKGFYVHFAFYLLFCFVFSAINLFSSPDYFWAFWPIMGWGIGVASHGLSVFGSGLGKNWEERKVRELMLREQHGLSADEVRQLLRDELSTERPLPHAAEWERVQRRLENLEAIVTSKEWDLLDDTPSLLNDPASELSTETEHEEDTPARRADHLSRRIR